MSYTPDPIDLARIREDLDRLPEAFDIVHQRWAAEIAADWKAVTHEVDAIDSWNYLNSIAAQKASSGLDAEETKLFVIDNSSDPMVVYGDIVERGRKDTPKYPVRYPAGTALERQYNTDAVEHIVTHTLDGFLHR